MINKKVYGVLLVGFRTIFPVYSHKYNILDQLCKLKASVRGKKNPDIIFFKHSILIIHYILYIYNKQTKQDTYRKKTLDPIQCRKIVFYSLKLNMFVFIKYPRFFSLPRKQHEMKIKKKNFVLLKKKWDDQTYDIVHLSYDKIFTQKRHISMVKCMGIISSLPCFENSNKYIYDN